MLLWKTVHNIIVTDFCLALIVRKWKLVHIWLEMVLILIKFSYSALKYNSLHNQNITQQRHIQWHIYQVSWINEYTVVSLLPPCSSRLFPAHKSKHRTDVFVYTMHQKLTKAAPVLHICDSVMRSCVATLFAIKYNFTSVLFFFIIYTTWSTLFFHTHTNIHALPWTL